MFVLLAFPLATDAERADLATSVCAAHLRAMFKEFGSADGLVKEKYAFRDEQRIKDDLKTLDRLIRDRMVAAKIVIPFLRRASGHTVKLPRGVQRLSLNQLAEYAMKEANQSSPENFKTRVWRPSLPVIHLAAAVAVTINDRERVGEKKTGYGNLIADAEFLFMVLTYTKEFEFIIKNNKLPIDPKKLVSIQLAR
ncbi:hypothetical protein [Bradyrhizobium sp. 2S1]|uniref:hypothetical protein n=1 Tax=Bradyrhizobium sp. 2S1 TaxID=1404429 RepID=UPI001408EE40|nr:hypothetical protein [Bradyrhizobium sp. 2S1]MCK7670942.1 hypothetical protein [Bradyrhizobium sp. 2S1]